MQKGRRGPATGRERFASPHGRRQTVFRRQAKFRPGPPWCRRARGGGGRGESACGATMERMRIGGTRCGAVGGANGVEGVRRAGAAMAVCGTLVVSLAACGGSAETGRAGKGDTDSGDRAGRSEARKADPTRIPDVGDRLQKRIPADSRQVVAVYGEGVNDADSKIVITEHGISPTLLLGSFPVSVSTENNGHKVKDAKPT